MAERIKLEGFYNFNRLKNGREDLSGEIEFSEDGSFEGEVYDEGSRNPRQLVRGYFELEEDVKNLEFVKFPRDSGLANLAYKLSKEDDSDFLGKYVGNWGALPYKIEMDQKSGLYLEKIDLNLTSSPIGDYAEIELFKE